VPKAAKDTVLTTRTRRAEQALTDECALDQKRVENLRRDGATVWYVEVLSPAAMDPESREPYVSFQVAQFASGYLGVVSWAIVGTDIVRLGEASRFPLRTYARAAIFAVQDALDEGAGVLFNGQPVSRRPYVSDFELKAGRLTDLRTRQVRISPRRAYVRSAGSARRDLRRVADEYRAAVERGSQHPTADVADAFNVSRASASRDIREARRQKLLGPALGTRAGEAR
jgi:hypothetical protein